MHDISSASQLTCLLLALAFIQSSAEHLRHGTQSERGLFAARLTLSTVLIATILIGARPHWVLLSTCLVALAQLKHFHGPYNGGSDRMGVLVLLCMTAIAFAPNPLWQETFYSYLAFQLTASYVISGYVKIKNPEWRSGQALCDVFLFSAYPVSESLRAWAQHPQRLFALSWAVMLFEIMFPLAFLSPTSLKIALVLAACFHLSNAFLFGLNRFFWIWLSAYPALLWLQIRLDLDLNFLQF